MKKVKLLNPNKTSQDKYNNDWYHPGAGYLKRAIWFLVNAFFLINPMNPFSSLKIFLLKIFGAEIGKNVLIKPAVNIKYPWHLKIGNHVWIGENVWIDNLTNVTIADHVCVSQGAVLLTGNHNYKKSTFDLIIGEIILEEGVWIGAKSIVSPGVTCRSHAVLSVNSVATKDLDPYYINVGNPCKKVRERYIS